MRPILLGLTIILSGTLPAATSLASPRGKQILLHTAIGTPSALLISGRARRRPIAPLPADSSRLRKLGRSLRLLFEGGARHRAIVISIAGKRYTTLTDRRGYFQLHTEGDNLSPGRHIVSMEVSNGRSATRDIAQLQIFATTPGIAVVSDIDDTLLDTGVDRPLRMLGRALVGSARDLRATPGALAFFRQQKRIHRPLLFISSSPASLYPRLRAFTLLKGIAANLLLRRGRRGGHAHKLEKLELLHTLLPNYRFILLGDSGQRDPEIYRRFAANHPEAVHHIAIRRHSDRVRLDDVRFTGMQIFEHFDEVSSHLTHSGSARAAVNKLR
ncbi:MAG: DUF2183 domain-containing protein [Deltaproteobacteria bacterium]|nr:DUF2183 domain-containing protein [Deltaproteobacteria bacterium]